MDTTRLGRWGLHLSRLTLGTATFGSALQDDEAIRILDAAIDRGFTLIDTANSYPVPVRSRPVGTAETIVGKWLRRHRQGEVLVATKCGFPTVGGPNSAGGGRRHIVESCEASLRRLGVDRID